MLSTESAALEYAYARYRRDVYAFVLVRVRNRDDAEELTQQTFADAAAALARGVAPRAMRGWLFTVAARRVTDELRRRGRLPVVAEPRVVGETAGTLSSAFERLTPDERLVLFLRFVYELSHAEIAATVGCSEASSKMRVSRALARLRRELARDV
jgi:RNA polymerase sigma-70 factor (ECF subfamily)